MLGKTVPASVPLQVTIKQSAHLCHNVLILLYVTVPCVAPCSPGSSDGPGGVKGGGGGQGGVGRLRQAGTS